MMKNRLLYFLLFCTFYSSAHENDFVVSDVEISKDNELLSLSIINNSIEELVSGELIIRSNSRTLFQETVSISGLNKINLNFKISKFNIELESLVIDLQTRTSNQLLASWPNDKQVNTFASEFYADAPWRIQKFDSLGSLNGFPIHFFLHDADLVPIFDLEVDNIKIQLKNAEDQSFGLVLTYDSWDINSYKDLFTCQSPNDPFLSILEFDQNSFTSSSNATINFIAEGGDYQTVNDTYWYFSFLIPGEELTSYNDVIDVLVTIEYSHFGATDEVIGLRIFRMNDEMPAMEGYYRGDTHIHSMYTQSDAEIGLPLCATKEASKYIGIDWITTTDHTSDFDNYGIGIAENWQRIQNEALELNTLDPSFIFIAGQEVAELNTDSKLVHMLAYPPVEDPFALPFVGDGNGDVIQTNVTVDEALQTLVDVDGFAYAAHPFSTNDELPLIPVNGGIWNMNSDQFPANDATFPETGGNIICNNLAIASDVFSSNPNVLVKDGLIGGQIWNSKNNLISSADALDPWDVQGAGGGLSQNDTTGLGFHVKRFEQGQEIVNHINQLGLKMKNLDFSAENWKFFYSAGTDAHGSFNSSNTGDFAGLGSISSNAVGKITTIAHCPEGMGPNGENVLFALKNGRTTLSDGPILTIGISKNGDNNVEAEMGETLLLNVDSPVDNFLVLDYVNSAEFGNIQTIKLFLGTEDGEFQTNITPDNSPGQHHWSSELSAIISNFGSGSLTQNDFYYIRAELETQKNYNGQNGVYGSEYDNFHSFTNPVWFSYHDSYAIEEFDKLFVKVYPNPANETIQIEFSELNEFGHVEIQDISGKVVFESEINKTEFEVDISKFSAGDYSIILSNSSNSIVTHLIKL